MSDITKYDGETLPIKSVADLQIIGSQFERSGMFGCSQEGQGMVLAMTCVQERISPLKFVQTYHIIDGRPSMRADAMLARFMELGGSYEILARDADKAEISVVYKKGKGVFSFSWEDAQKESFPFKKDGSLKTNWATPRARMQLLWARVTSDAVRAICPMVNCGSYTPEEVEDFDDKSETIPSSRPSRKSKMNVSDPIETTVVETSSTTVEKKPPTDEPDQAAEPPTDEPDQAAEPPTDPEVMPVGKHAGKKWIEFPTAALRQALDVKDARITDAHKHAISIVVEQRKAVDLDASKKTNAKKGGKKS